jgi:transglutaminase/protease-like cytokinesis protein 3
MMKEAQSMMEDPNFQANMKKMMQGQGFQEAMTQTNTDLQDPVKLKAMEKKAEKAIAEGNIELEEKERLRRLQVTAAVEKATKDRQAAEAEAGAEAGEASGEDDKKQAAVEEVADVKKEEDDVPAFALNLN